MGQRRSTKTFMTTPKPWQTLKVIFCTSPVWIVMPYPIGLQIEYLVSHGTHMQRSCLLSEARLKALPKQHAYLQAGSATRECEVKKAQ